MSARVPGVYREDVLPIAEPAFRTGVPAFLAPLPAGEPRQLGAATHLAAVRDALGDSFVVPAVEGFFACGGRLCYLVPFDLRAGRPARDHALDQIAALDDVDLIAAPDQPSSAAELRDLQLRLLEACDGGPRLVLLDAPARGNLDTERYVQAVAAHARDLAGRPGSRNAALYFPWLGTRGRVVPPCGHIAGLFAAADAAVGPHKAPAGDVVRGVVDLDVPVTAARQRELADLPLNCVCAFNGRGIRVWGARTLATEPADRAIHVRRLILTTRRNLEQRMEALAFEPNTSWLWARITRELSTYLQSLYEGGALRGASPTQAFSVRCDESTNPPEVRDSGAVHAEIDLSPAASIETIVLRLRVSPQARVATIDETTA